MKLNLGCGSDRREGYVNCDVEPRCSPDQVVNVEGVWPFEDGAVTEIMARHVLEHLQDIRVFFREAYRVMAPGALMHIAVPHHRSEGFAGDFTHVRIVTRAALDLLSREKCAEFAAKGWPNTPLAIYWEVDFEVTGVSFDLMSPWRDRGLTGRNLEEAILGFNNVIDECRFTLVRV